MKERKLKNGIMAALCTVFLWGCGGQDGLVVELSQEYPETAAASADIETMTAPPETDEEPGMLYVYLCGAVAAPGVYQLAEGSRLFEAVEMAGGLDAAADGTCLNMARELADGEQIVVLTCEETQRLRQEGKYPPGQEADAAAGGAGLVNINTASLSELTTVPGIGEGRAQAIIAYRETNGGFACIEDIKKVDGIKDGLFAKIRDKITV